MSGIVGVGGCVDAEEEEGGVAVDVEVLGVFEEVVFVFVFAVLGDGVVEVTGVADVNGADGEIGLAGVEAVRQVIVDGCDAESLRFSRPLPTAPPFDDETEANAPGEEGEAGEDSPTAASVLGGGL
jgi:hypothetical protein